MKERFIKPVECVTMDMRQTIGLDKQRPDMEEMSNRYAHAGYVMTGMVSLQQHPLPLVYATFTHFGAVEALAEEAAENVEAGQDLGPHQAETPTEPAEAPGPAPVPIGKVDGKPTPEEMAAMAEAAKGDDLGEPDIIDIDNVGAGDE